MVNESNYVNSHYSIDYKIFFIKHYRNAVIHPYASTVAEEMFQRHFIPSDTDFRIFRDHGKVPGLDMESSL